MDHAIIETQEFRAIFPDGTIKIILARRQDPVLPRGVLSAVISSEPWVAWTAQDTQGYFWGETARAAIVAYLHGHHLDYAELRGPEEFTTAEQVQAAVNAQRKQCRWWMCGRKCNPDGSAQTLQENRELWDATPSWIQKVIDFCALEARSELGHPDGRTSCDPNDGTVERVIKRVEGLKVEDVRRGIR
jgi:hypothetical protein